jgi:hypothetical protein
VAGVRPIGYAITTPNRKAIPGPGKVRQAALGGLDGLSIFGDQRHQVPNEDLAWISSPFGPEPITALRRR